MLAPIATLAFLLSLWTAAKLVVDMLAEDGAKVAAALAGRSMIANPPQSVRPVTVRLAPRPAAVRRPVHAQPQWRAAA